MATRRSFVRGVLGGLLGASTGCRAGAQPPAGAAPADPADFLERLRRERDLPALAAAVLRDDRLVFLRAVGVRKAGDPTPVADGDCFHIGSCTKAMTATLVARLVEEGRLRWETTLATALPELAERMAPEWRETTLAQLLCHRAGLPERSWPAGISFRDVHRLPGPPEAQRRAYTERMLAERPAAPPGTKFLYSNAGYAIAGHIAERAAGMPFEEAMRARLFRPLGMKSAGFGAMGTPGRLDQPRQHRGEGLLRRPVEPGPESDNPPAIAPAGTLHLSMGDWAAFALEHLRGARGEGKLLSRETYQRLHTPPFGGDYAFGWLVVERNWGGGRVLTHAGSNTMNFAVAWLAPLRRFAVLVATNQGGEGAARACDEAAAGLIERLLEAPRRQSDARPAGGQAPSGPSTGRSSRLLHSFQEPS